jgi:glycosyl transferase family 87
MTSHDIEKPPRPSIRTLKPPDSPAQAGVPRIIITVCLALCAMNGVWWLLAALSGQWIFDSRGFGIPTDFANVYAAGRLALEGHPALAYDWEAHKRIQEVVLGRVFDGYLSWHYPPPYLFVAELLARLPYGVAFVCWVVVSAIPYAMVVRLLAGHRVGWLIACACPMAQYNVMIGQNGFLTAALIGGAVYLMPRRPWLAGLCIGLLIYKPQYGLLFPLVLVAARQWKPFFAAALTTAALAALSWAAFGADTWAAFFSWLPRASRTFLVDGGAEFGKMQSVLSLTRYLGGGDTLAQTLQWSVTGIVAVAMVALWRSRVLYEIKAAALATAVLLATPYLYTYDMVVLAVPVALIVDIGAASGFLRYELAMLGFGTLLLVGFPFVVAPVGVAATLLIAALIARRAVASWKHDPHALLNLGAAPSAQLLKPS